MRAPAMYDDNLSHGDGVRIRMAHEQEVDYWCKKFRITKAQLEHAVNAVGPEVERVQEYLAQPRS